jgi:hypothetical protein
MERKTFCAALSRYGAQAQITMVFEEMAELQDVLCKFLRGRVDGDTLANIVPVRDDAFCSYGKPKEGAE